MACHVRFVRFRAVLPLLVVAVLGATAVSQAGIIAYYSRSEFEAQGSIDYKTNFDGLHSEISYLGNPYTAGGVTYRSSALSGDQMIVIGTGTSYEPVRNIIANNYNWYPLKGDIDAASQYSMFGFDFGMYSGTHTGTPANITLYTNAATYEVNGVSAPWVGASLGFAGFSTTGAGEYFAGFKVTAADTAYHAPGLTDVTVGWTAVPEPSLGLLLLLGIVPLGIAYRRRKQS